MRKIFYFIAPLLFFVACSTTQKTEPQKEILQKPNLQLGSNLTHEQNLKILPKTTINTKFNIANFLKRKFDILQTKSINTKENLAWAFDIYKNSAKRQYYGMNKLPLSDEWFLAQKDNAHFEALGQISKPALTKTQTLVRNFPTNEKIFLDPVMAGEGYPFDYLQVSVLSAFEPVFISHYSKDGAYAFVKTDAIWGFVSSQNLEILDEKGVDNFINSNFATFQKDKIPVFDTRGNFLFSSRVGGLFPYEKSDGGFYYSSFFSAKIAKNSVSNFQSLNDKSLIELINPLLGEPYGWGGENFHRDCSLFLKDIFASFGLWLPRNSKAQAATGVKFDLKNMTNDEKKSFIKMVAKPFLTLLHLNGHIMLYAGEINGELMAVHDIWGLRTKDNKRNIIGQIALTSLEIGKDDPNIDSKNLLLSRLNSINLLDEDRNLIFQKTYNVKILDNKIIFDDNSTMEFDNNQSLNYDNPSVKKTIEIKYPIFEPLDANLTEAGRFRNQEFFGKIYGASEDEVRANLVEVVWLKSSLNKILKFNQKNGAAKALQRVSDELDELSKKEPEILKFLNNPGGTFNYRFIVGTKRLSAHSYAIAIDINVDKSSYWRWQKEYKNEIPAKIVRIFEKNGFIWGGRWQHFDTMHFEYRPEFSLNF